MPLSRLVLWGEIWYYAFLARFSFFFMLRDRESRLASHGEGKGCGSGEVKGVSNQRLHRGAFWSRNNGTQLVPRHDGQIAGKRGTVFTKKGFSLIKDFVIIIEET